MVSCKGISQIAQINEVAATYNNEAEFSSTHNSERSVIRSVDNLTHERPRAQQDIRPLHRSQTDGHGTGTAYPSPD